jgi:hypothetical protein
MNFLYKCFAIIYKTYDDKGLDIPHFRAISTVIFCLFLHIVHIGLLLDVPSNFLMPWNSQESKALQWLKAAIFFTIPILLISIVFTKKKLDSVSVTDNQISKAKRILPVYFFLSIALLVILLIRHGLRKGTIHL